MTQALLTQATTLTVFDTTTMVQAGTLLGKIKDYKKKLKEEEDSLTEVHLKEVTKVRAIYKPKRDKIEAVIKYISEQVNTYQTELARIEREKQDKIAARVEKGTLKMETALTKLEQIEKPIDSVTTASGTIKFRTVKELQIIDAQLIPREYLIVDTVKVEAALKGGVDIPGALLIEVKKISNYGA